MKSQKIVNVLKNAAGTVWLLAGAFFVCSTFLSARSVWADPIAPINDVSQMGPQAVRAGGATARNSGRASPRNRATVNRATVARTAVAGENVNVAPARANQSRVNAARAVSGRTVSATPRTNVTGNARVNATSTRNVVTRQNAATSRANANVARSVRARTATTEAANNARISLQGSAIRGSKATPTSSYSYLTNKLYTGNYSNIIDSTTGLISTDAFNNCMESYYTCMDEICTARNAAQRRCACAGRVRAFAEAETQLEQANEELIKVSGELALLIANKGKDVSEAFQLTDAEKVMNCVSWQDVTNQYGVNSAEAIEWCSNHGIYNNGATVTSCAKPAYCSESGNNFGFDVTNLDGNGSDILASLQSWASAKEQTLTITMDDTDSLTSAFDNLSSVVSGLGGFGGALESSDTLKDSLAETWGYELFEYAHNNVCARVLDSCFNGIYEACGTPPSGVKCGNGASQCPYNYNSHITVNNTGTYELNFVNASSGYTMSNSATCFGYTSASGDPYTNLRGPVADARRSIMQKYALDANADCDAYGEQLRATAQNIGYQKVAAQQALQQKRLEFAINEKEEVLTAALTAGTNFDECLSEINDCFETQARSNSSWTTARIRTYCSQIANVPHCYEEMICNPSVSQFHAVIDDADSEECLNSQDYTTNTCRNVVTLNEILNGTGAATHGNIVAGGTGSSIGMREQCLLDAGVESVRTWSKETEGLEPCKVSELPANAAAGVKDKGATVCSRVTSCYSGYVLSNNQCVLATTDCSSEIPNSKKATRVLDQSSNTWGACVLESCEENYDKKGNECLPNSHECYASALPVGAQNGIQTWTGAGWSECIVTECRLGYELIEDKNECWLSMRTCDTLPDGVITGTQTLNGTTYDECVATECMSGYLLQSGKCVKETGAGE